MRKAKELDKIIKKQPSFIKKRVIVERLWVA